MMMLASRNRTLSVLYLTVTILIGALSAFGACGEAAVDPILEKANALLRAGQAESAHAVYVEYLRKHPNALPAQLALAEIAYRRFDFDKARRILEHTLAKHPDSPEAAASLGRLYQLWANSPAGTPADNAKDYLALAHELLTQAVTLGPNNPLALTYMAEWQVQQNQLPLAEQNLQKVLQMNPAFVPALQAQVRLYMKGNDMRRAKDAALHAIEIDPENSMSYFLTAQLLALAQRPAEAVRYAEKSEQFDYGKSPERDYFLAEQYETLGQLDQAVQYYRNLTVYTPKQANIWMKLGDLLEAQNRSDDSLTAYRKALQLEPGILTSLYVQAREATRQEKIQPALRQWRKLLAIRPDDAATLNEAWSAMASLHFLHRFLHPETASPQLSKDMHLLAKTPYDKANPVRLLDQVKLVWASQGMTEAVQQQLKQLAASSEPAVAGEAAFLLGDYAKSREYLEAVDGLSVEEYTFWADRLLLEQALNFAQVFYQRAYELSRAPDLQAAMKRVQAKQALATKRLNEGNVLFQAKNYTEAASKYREATRIYPEWDNAYLRLGDTYEQLKQWADAKKAYDQAIALSPSLMDSKGFAKNYQRLAKRASRK